MFGLWWLCRWWCPSRSFIDLLTPCSSNQLSSLVQACFLKNIPPKMTNELKLMNKTHVSKVGYGCISLILHFPWYSSCRWFCVIHKFVQLFAVCVWVLCCLTLCYKQANISPKTKWAVGLVTADSRSVNVHGQWRCRLHFNYFHNKLCFFSSVTLVRFYCSQLLDTTSNNECLVLTCIEMTFFFTSDFSLPLFLQQKYHMIMRKIIYVVRCTHMNDTFRRTKVLSLNQVSVRTFGIMYNHTLFHTCTSLDQTSSHTPLSCLVMNIIRLNQETHTKWAVRLLITN